jgi:hypothetical protein
MLIPNHPHDERLSALASGDPEVLADSALSEHVASCHRCADTVAEFGALRASLAELPDLRPLRPLQLVPPVTEPSAIPVDGVGAWARRLFAPVLTAGAALAMVGLVGTSVPLLGQGASQAPPGGAEMADQAEESDMAATRADDNYTFNTGGGADDGSGDREAAEEPAAEPLESEADGRTLDATAADGEQVTATTAVQRSIWPMVLFTGVALMVAAALLRWILAPRAG